MRRRSPFGITWSLATVAGATAVGITTHSPGFVVITLLGGLWLPRLLGFGWGGPPHHRGGPGCHGGHVERLDRRLQDWHRHAHGEGGEAAAGGDVATV